MSRWKVRAARLIEAWDRVALPAAHATRWFFGQTWIALTFASIALPAFFLLPLLIAWLGRDLHPNPPAPTREEVRIATTLGGALAFSDVEAQSREFIGYYTSITLTPEQETIKAAVLEDMPAACCNGSTAYTCCCPCNLSKTLWGLSNYLIAERGAGEPELREAVYAWMNYTNPRGYTGEACYKGGCEGAFHTNGCGGMDEDKIAV